MTLAELQRALRAADPRAVLVPPRILERIIVEAYDLRGPSAGVPHRKCHVADRRTLFRHAEQADLDLEPDQLLPDTVILLARPPAEELGDLERSLALLKYWRLLFHASVHLALDRGPAHFPGSAAAPGLAAGGTAAGGDRDACGDDRLSPAALADRVAAVGRTEFEEVRAVLTQDHFLLPSATDRAVYVEFAAVYLETRHFAAALLPGLFPGLRDPAAVDAMLAADVDADALFARTRLAGAADPVAAGDTGADKAESHAQYWLLVRSAERASLAGNTVGAAVLRNKAWRIAPAAQSQETRDLALADMRRLAERLAAALKLDPTAAAGWAAVLPPLLDKADQGNRPAEARLLGDLQKVCLDHEQDLYTLDLVEWALSAGRRPVKRPLPGLRLVRTARHLRAAAGRLGAVRLSDADRGLLAGLLQTAHAAAEASLRDRFGKALATALQDAGLQPVTAPGRVAFAKMVEEWLDRVLAQGFLTFSDLRDGISRNQLKMPDLRDPEDFIRGDPLLRLDRRLAALLDGVYRPSAVYTRLLERTTALNFGTRLGRRVTLWFTVPVGGALLLLQILGVLLHLVVDTAGSPAAHVAHQVLVGPWLHGGTSADASPAAARAAAATPGATVLNPAAAAAAATQPTAAAATTTVPHADPNPTWHVLLLVAVAATVAALVHVPAFRRACRRGLKSVARAVRHVVVDLPAALLKVEAFQRLARSWALKLVAWYVLRPLLVAAVLCLLVPAFRRTWPAAAVVCLAALLVLNSRLGEAATRAAAQASRAAAELVRAGLLPGLYRLVVQAFRHVVDGVELFLFNVDDWLRFRTGDTQASLVLRTTLGVLWYPVAYLARFYMLVLVEPGFNPVKAPVSYVAAKVMLPISVPLTGHLVGAVAEVTWDWLAYALVLPTVWLLPDVFGFLFWETKENWSLYRANRRRSMRPVPVGPHAETVEGLLKPGFHSGTVPRLYQRLRRAEREAVRTRDWSAARTVRHQLDEVAKALGRFVDRELVGLLHESASWAESSAGAEDPASAGDSARASDLVRASDLPRRGKPLLPAGVTLAVNRVTVTLAHRDHPAAPVRVEVELRAGWLVAGVSDAGWLAALPPAAVRSFATALAGLYKLAGVCVVREQVAAHLPPAAAGWDLTPAGLVVRFADGRPVAVYDPGLRPDPAATADAEADVSLAGGSPGGRPDRLLFAHTRVVWQQWLATWEQERAAGGHPGLDGWDRELIPPLPGGEAGGRAAAVADGATAGPPSSDPLAVESLASRPAAINGSAVAAGPGVGEPHVAGARPVVPYEPVLTASPGGGQ
jgi:hypothetical protein